MEWGQVQPRCNHATSNTGTSTAELQSRRIETTMERGQVQPCCSHAAFSTTMGRGQVQPCCSHAALNTGAGTAELQSRRFNNAMARGQVQPCCSHAAFEPKDAQTPASRWPKPSSTPARQPRRLPRRTMPYPEGLGHCRRRVRPVQTFSMFAHRRSNLLSPPQLPSIATVIQSAQSTSTVISTDTYCHQTGRSTAALQSRRSNTGTSTAELQSRRFGPTMGWGHVQPRCSHATSNTGTSTAELQSRRIEPTTERGQVQPGCSHAALNNRTPRHQRPGPIAAEDAGPARPQGAETDNAFAPRLKALPPQGATSSHQ